jgi:transposase-like protein
MSMSTHEQSVIVVPPNGISRRRFSKSYKRELVEQTFRPDVSMAAVALANGINTNLLAHWRRYYPSPALLVTHMAHADADKLGVLQFPVTADGRIELALRGNPGIRVDALPALNEKQAGS